MRQRYTFRIIVVTLAVAAAVPAAAQTPTTAGKRWVFGGGVLWQSAAPEATASLEFPTAREAGTLDTVFTPKSTFGLDLNLSARLAGAFGVGASVSLYAPGQDAEAGGTLTARVPHPFVSNMPRVVSMPAGLTRKELAAHTNVLYFLEPSDRVLLILGGGLSLYRAHQTFAQGIEYHEETPATPTTAVVTRVHLLSASGTGLGWNGGLEGIWLADPNVGISALARYARGTVTFSPGGQEMDTPTGGLQLAVGIRFLY